MRVSVSVPLPGPKGTMILTGLVGKACARAIRDAAGSAAAPAARCRNCRRGSFTIVMGQPLHVSAQRRVQEMQCLTEILPADGPLAARCNHRDFGTSRLQLR